MLTVEFDRLHLGAGAILLDLGCGEGRHTRAARLLSGVNVIAVDIGAREVETTSGSVREMEEPAAPFPAARDAGAWLVLRGDSSALPFADGTIDCVIAAEILEHLLDDDQALEEIFRVLKPGGEVVVSVPRFGPEALCWALSREYRNSEGGHVRIYRRSALARKIAAHGFELYAAHFAHALHAPYWWLKCALGLQRTGGLIGLYERFLVWEMFEKPRATRLLERLLNPLIGKSEVFYGRKPALARQPVSSPRHRPEASSPRPVAVAASVSLNAAVEGEDRRHWESQDLTTPQPQRQRATTARRSIFRTG